MIIMYRNYEWKCAQDLFASWQKPVASSCEHGNKTSGFIKGRDLSISARILASKNYRAQWS
jgi:hypothetical protein